MISVYIVDDHTLFAQGLAGLLKKEPWIFQVIIFDSPDDFLSIKGSLKEGLANSVFLLDINFNRILNGVDVCRELKGSFPSSKIITLTMHDEHHYISAMKEAGTDGYLFKNEPIQTILHALRKVSAGEMFFSPKALEVLKKYKQTHQELLNLNSKEKRVLELLQQGKTNKEIGEIMEYSYKTIEYYKNGLFLKFDVKNSKTLLRKLSSLK